MTTFSASSVIQDSFDLLLLRGEPIDAGHWQGMPTEGKPDLQTREVLDLTWTCDIPPTATECVEQCKPNMPWAEEEFAERVGGEARNPHNSLPLWPWWRGGHQAAATHAGGEDFKFTHTYSERFWPKDVGSHWCEGGIHRPATGIRYPYGDLYDLLDLLYRQPHTRQATLPIFFPEDTGAVHGGRIPCTLHYHFMLRENKLHMWYPIRSCDAVRHFRDDVYMAMRLDQWVLGQMKSREAKDSDSTLWAESIPGSLSFTAYSFHAHMGDWHLLQEGLV